jgi:spore germination protein KB
MELENGRFPAWHLSVLIIGFILGSSVILPPGREAGNAAWLAILLGAGEGLLFAWIFIALANRFQGKTLVEIVDIVYGPYFGKLVGVAYLGFIFHLGAIVIRNFTDFFTTAIIPETPALIIAAALILTSGLALFYGLEVIVRCSLILVPFAIILIIILVALQVPWFNWVNFLPLIDVPLEKFLRSIHGAAAFPFAETVAFLMLFPYAIRSKEKIGKATAIAIILAAALSMLTSVRGTAILGNTGSVFTYPTFETVKMLDLPFVDTRFEIFVALDFMAMGFLKITVLYYGTVLGAAQLLRLRTYQPFILPVGVLMVSASLVSFNNIIENIELATLSYPFYAPVFELIVPLITLLVAWIRKQGGK